MEVLCGTLHDSSEVLEDITRKLTDSLQSFYDKYPILGLDFHEEVKWLPNSKEHEMWESVSSRIENGPSSTTELDQLKTSIHAERRTDDQKVSIIKFIASEKNVAFNARQLNTALESAKHASAASKLAAAEAVIRGHTLAYEVASIFAPLIAEKKYVSWNGFTYINLIEEAVDDDSDPDASKTRMRNLVILWLPTSMGQNVAEAFGSRKLGQVFLALLKRASLESSIQRYMLFCLLLRSKPDGWKEQAKKITSEMNRDDIYLRHLLSAALRQFREEINTEVEREGLKEVVAAIRLRRDANVKKPSQTEIARAVGRLDKSGFWETKSVNAESAVASPTNEIEGEFS